MKDIPSSVSHQGLSADEAARRLREDGPNALPEDKHRLFAVLLEAIKEPMFLLLIAAAALYLALGDLHEGLLLLFMVCVTVGLTLYQEGKTERALTALRDLSSPRALVLRNGQAIRVPGQDVVRNDLLILSEGDRIAADAVLIETNNLQIDESLLTGEAWAVRKRTATDEEVHGKPGGEDLPFAWAGTLVVQGTGLARVTATGPRSEIGKIGSAIQKLGPERSPLQRETARLVKLLAIAGVSFSLLIAGIYGILRGDWLQAILVGIALAMSLLPEEYPVILAVFPAIGAWRMSRAQVLTRRLAAIETLGSISVLCTDKTGTLTENRMKVVQMQIADKVVDLDGAHNANLSPPFIELAECTSLASKPHAFDPMETAFHTLAGQFHVGVDSRAGREPIREYPLSPELRAMSLVWENTKGNGKIVAAKGAPEAIAMLCRFDKGQLRRLHDQIDQLAAQGLRVLAVARADFNNNVLPDNQLAFEFKFLGLAALADPIRAEISDAMRECVDAGIRVLMITGDYPGTAASIARQAGLPNTAVMSGEEIDTLSDPELRERLRQVGVCARITPAQKLRIVEALKAQGEIVAMTGDGVNDAPALKAAHVGIAMGGRGTDVAREASAIVLLDDNFASIVRGIRLGRRIYTNMRNAMSYVLSMHVPIAGIALLPLAFGWPIALFPVHMAFLELIIDPACSLAFENEASDINAMRRPPRNPNAPLLGRGVFIQATLQGSVALLLVALAYFWGLQYASEEKARAIAFAALVVANLGLIFSNLSRSRSAIHALHSNNKLPLIVAGATSAVLLLTIYFPPMATAFRFSALTISELGMSLTAGLSGILGYELIKFATNGATHNPRIKKP